MGHLSPEAKEVIVLKAINRGSATIESIARANNVGLSSLQKWLRQYREGAPPNSKVRKKAATSAITREEQLNHILATHALDDVSLGKYCRVHGLYSHQLTQWRDALMKTPDDNKDQQQQQQQQQAELRKLKDENQRLQRELQRKEKALAEASALLIMKKKADLIWGGDEED